MPDIPNIEIFRAGEWNGDKYSIADLDDMVSNFGRVGFNVPVKLGHSKEPGEPAYGWVSALKRVGDRLTATLSDVPEQVSAALAARRFDHVSAEIFWNIKRAGQTFRRALKAVALLGAEAPAVTGLKPISESMRGFASAYEDYEQIALYSFSMKGADPMQSAKSYQQVVTENPNPGAEVHRKVLERQRSAPQLNYAQAMADVLADPDNQDLKVAYAIAG